MLFQEIVIQILRSIFQVPTVVILRTILSPDQHQTTQKILHYVYGKKSVRFCGATEVYENE